MTEPNPTQVLAQLRSTLAEHTEMSGHVPYAPDELVSIPAGDLRVALAAAATEGAAEAIGRLCDEIDEDKRHSGFDLVMWLTGLQNGIRSGAVTLDRAPSPA